MLFFSILLTAGLFYGMPETLSTRLSSQSDSSFDPDNAALHGFFLSRFALIPGALAVLGSAAARWALPVLPPLQRAAVWALAVGILGPDIAGSLFTSPFPDGGYETRLAQMILVERIGNFTGLLSGVCLVVVPLFALVFRRKTTSPKG